MSEEVSHASAFGSKLREWRLAKKFTLRKFAEAIKVSPTYVSGIENGTLQPPTFERLQAISALLEVPLDDLVDAAGRWQAMASQSVESRPEFVRLLRAANRLTKEEIDALAETLEKDSLGGN
ncbi:MAG: helix-turn-helix transcriptional regulator [Armatimonadetes bacterium]|nr:helix-turn-helix transcriptional regulator [Armatimonadota bacterium]